MKTHEALAKTPTGEIFRNGGSKPEYPGVSEESVFDSKRRIYVPREEFTNPKTYKDIIHKI